MTAAGAGAGAAFFAGVDFGLGLDFGSGVTTAFSDFLVLALARFGGGEGERSGDAARFLGGFVRDLGTGLAFIVASLVTGFGSGFVEVARVDRLGGMMDVYMSANHRSVRV